MTTPTRRLGFLGGYGHSPAWLERATTSLLAHGVELVDIPYPGFAGRAPAPDLETFLQEVASALEAARVDALYALGVGGALALFLRRQGAARLPILMQAPELLGTPRSLQLRWMRKPKVQRLVPRLWRSKWFTSLLARRYFQRPLDDAERSALFEGLAGCTLMFSLMAWINPESTADLKRFFQLERDLLHKDIYVWWGGRDVLVSEFELYEGEDDLTRVHWPVELYDAWGHYPMVDDPAGWAAEVARHLRGEPRRYTSG